MALGVLLQICWICFLLFDGSLASVKGYGRKDDRNIIDDDDDDVPPSSSVNQPPQAGASAGRPGVARWPSWASKKTPGKSSGLDVERLQNARPVTWGQERPDQPLVFPLPDKKGVSPPSGGSARQPSSDPKPSSGGHRVPGSAGGSRRPAVYEEVFKYPSQGSGAPHGGPSRAAGGAGQGSQAGYASLPKKQQPPAKRAWPTRTSSSQTGYQPPKGKVSWQQQPAVPKWVPPRKSAEPLLPAPPPPPVYIIQSSNGYQRFRKTYRKSKYSPDTKEVDPAFGPASDPIKNTQRYSRTKPEPCSSSQVPMSCRARP